LNSKIECWFVDYSMVPMPWTL